MCGQTEPWRSKVLGRGFAVSSPQASALLSSPSASLDLMEKSLNCGEAGGLGGRGEAGRAGLEGEGERDKRRRKIWEALP